LVKHFNVIMAGVISGIVALFTSILGISGTIIGSVISSFLYQLISSYSQEKFEEGSISKHNIAGEIVYIFPLVVIILIELIYCLSSLHYNFALVFNLLESATADNLFRVMGIGLIILSFYPFVKTNNIKRNNGVIVFILGVFVLLRGCVDLNSLFYLLYSKIFYRFDLIFSIIVILALSFVVINILRNSIDSTDSTDSYNFSNNHYNQNKQSNQNSNYFDYDEELPIYEEDYLYINNPDNPDNPIKRKILKKVKHPNQYDDNYGDELSTEK